MSSIGLIFYRDNSPLCPTKDQQDKDFLERVCATNVFQTGLHRDRELTAVFCKMVP